MRARHLAVLPALLLALVLAAGGAAAQQATLRGVVRDSATGTPVANAQVAVPALGASVRADTLGRFVLPGLAPGNYAVLAERLGYATRITPVQLAAGETVEREFLLRAAPTPVGGVTVEGRPGSPRLAQFEARRAGGQGKYLTQEQLAGQTDRRLSDIVRRIAPGVRAGRGNAGEMYLYNPRGIASGSLRDDPEPCYVQVIVDGSRVFGHVYGQSMTRDKSAFTVSDVNSIQVSELAGVEFYSGPANTPPEFRNGTDLCGTLAVWTRDGKTG
jgi:hypothetical protein